MIGVSVPLLLASIMLMSRSMFMPMFRSGVDRASSTIIPALRFCACTAVRRNGSCFARAFTFAVGIVPKGIMCSNTPTLSKPR